MAKEKYLFRNVDKELLIWKDNPRRKVLLLRGARQVGKSSAVRHLAKQFKYYLEINFEDVEEKIISLFEPGVSPQEICKKLSVATGVPIVVGETLLFLDEIQRCLPALSKLRFFYEKMPDLHLVAAGSLLEFALEEIPSFAVGRVTSLFMYPFSFEEFLYAMGKGMWAEAIQEASPGNPIFESVHKELLKLLKIFMLTGGMPEVVAEYVATENILDCQMIIASLLVSLRSDFAKYRKRIPATRINEVFDSVAHQADGKFVYEHAAVGTGNKQVKQALDLLIMAGLAYPVTHTSSNGIPLGAEVNTKFKRMFLFDTGLFQHILGLNLTDILFAEDFKSVNNGALAEVFVAHELVKNSSCYSPVSLYCWQRENRNGNAQVDFLIQKSDKILPIEVKAGNQGAMQSLHLFMKEKNSEYGIRTSLENFAEYDKIKVYPLYAIGNLIRN
ncbi:MAG: AAA family ATPase [Tannerella sp.]|jgi:predicted AAA+ superfamily ATPase|nr:AAA family ATPase [Tannerella sp.]